jgi:hypothetical protein
MEINPKKEKEKENNKIKIENVTVSESNTGLIGVDLVENALVSDLALGSQAYQAAYVGIRR